MKKHTYNEIENNAKIAAITNAKEMFITEYDNEYHFCDLKTLNFIMNEMKLNVKVIANVYLPEHTIPCIENVKVFKF